jgi:hypothetical protein
MSYISPINPNSVSDYTVKLFQKVILIHSNHLRSWDILDYTPDITSVYLYCVSTNLYHIKS